ncbi:MAG: hypothetical protein ACM3KR_08575 [Deltaproteobacteria bacterium]
MRLRSKKYVAILLVVCLVICSLQITGMAKTAEAAAAAPAISPSLPPQLALIAAAGELVILCGEELVQSFSQSKEDFGNSGNGKNKKEKKPSPVPLSIKLVGSDAALLTAAKNIKPIQGYTDVIIHGAPKFFGVFRNGTWVKINPRSLATFMRQSGYKGGPIRLISCNSGKVSDGVAQDLSNKLGEKVIAPTNTVWIANNGRLIIGDTPIMPKGHWHAFMPGR